MANAAFDIGYSTGLQRGGEARERKQALSDAELQQKINDQLTLRQAQMEKLRNLKPGTPEYDQAHKGLFDTFTNLRNLYHPQNNPNAIQKFGHLLTDHLGLTHPEQRAGEQQRKNVQALAGDETSTGQFVAAMPPSDIEAAHNQVQVEMGALQEKVKQTIAAWDENNKGATQEQREHAHKEISDSLLWGYKPSATSERGNWETIYGTKAGPDGKPVRVGYRHNKYSNETTGLSGEDLPEDFFQGFQPDPKSSRAPKIAWSKDKNGRIFSVQLDDNNQIRPGTENYNVLPPAGMLPTIRTGVYHWVDENNAVHETPETTTSRKDFTGTVGAGGGGGTPSQAQPRTGTSNPPNQGNVNSVAPPRQTHLQSPNMMKQKIAHNFQNQDKILGYKGNAVLTKAENTLSDAAGISDLADKLSQQAETNPDGMSEADTQFVLKLIKSDAGRVNLPEIGMLFNAGGLAEGPERWLAKIGHGQLSPDLRNQLIEFAHSMRDVAQQRVNELKTHPGDPNSPAPTSTGGDWRKRAIPVT